MDALLKNLRRLMDSPAGALLGGSVYGAWALWVNWPTDRGKAIQAAAMHTLLSAGITLGSVALMRGLFAFGSNGRRGFIFAAAGSLGLTYVILIGFHLALGTPHVFLTLLPGAIPTIGFDVFYSYLLAREAGLGLRPGKSHVVSFDSVRDAATGRVAAGIEYACAVLAQADGMMQLVARHPKLRYAEHIGPHLRHIVEHFSEFLNGVKTGEIDYDRRARERALEREPTLMRAHLAKLKRALLEADPRSWPESVRVAAEGGLDGEQRFTCTSTPLRELLFLSSHATHHYALLKQLIEMRGVKLAEEFGKAPATIRFERGTAATHAA